MSVNITDFKGVIPAVLSVFDENEALDEKATRAFIRHLMSYDIGGLYLTGSTGEAFLQDSDERKKQVEIVMDEVAGRLPVVVHVGAISTKASIDLAKHAKSMGAAGVSSVPPFYYKFSEEQILGYYRDIAAAADLPMIVYNIPLAGMMTVGTIHKLSQLENVAGVKYTGTALYEETQIKDACGKDFLVYGGCDELGASNIALGVDGIIGSFYNCIPDLYLNIWKAVKANDAAEAARLQAKALHVIDLGLGSGSTMACLKLWLRAAGVPAGYARRPFTNFSADKRQELVKALLDLDEREQIGLDIAAKIRQHN